MEDHSLTGDLLELSRSLDEYRAAVRKAQAHFAFEVEKIWDDQAELRDHLLAVSNRVESLTRLVASPFEVHDADA